MMHHKLLQRQLKKYADDKLSANEFFHKFIEAVNDSYIAFDRDKELSDHAFMVSQQEFAEINNQLKEEVEIRKLSIQKLKLTLNNIKADGKGSFNSGDEDLLDILDLLNEEIKRRKEVEQQLLLAKNEAEQASLAKSEFLSIISHEIRTPLNAIIGMGHLLIKGNPRADQVDNLKTLKISADNLLVLINDILDFNKIEAGKLDLEEAPFSVGKLVEDIIAANTNTASEKQNKITVSIDERLPHTVLGDSLRIGQVLNNLVSNAVKFTQKGYIAVKVAVKELNDQFALIEFAVQDTGVGIPTQKIPEIFLPFTQASTSITRQYGGTGLGLAITKRILGLLNSGIHVESEVGKGSRFYFTLQLSLINDHEAVENVGNLAYPDLKNKRILLVEDTLFNVLYATQLLENWNAQVEVAENGLVAVEILKQVSFDLVLMDLQMPVMDGYTATENIRLFNTTTPIIALTASATSNVREKVIAAGMQDYVTKPFNPDDFLIKLKKHLG